MNLDFDKIMEALITDFHYIENSYTAEYDSEVKQLITKCLFEKCILKNNKFEVPDSFEHWGREPSGFLKKALTQYIESFEMLCEQHNVLDEDRLQFLQRENVIVEGERYWDFIHEEYERHESPLNINSKVTNKESTIDPEQFFNDLEKNIQD